MKTADTRVPGTVLGLILFGLLLANGACTKSPTVNANINTNLSTNANLTPANSNTTVAPSTLAAREPETYKGTLIFTAQTEGGENAIGIPPLSAEVARSGADRRLAFKLPDGSELIYLDRAGTPYAIAPGRKQYAELTPAATGFQLQKLMTPGQIVAHLDRLQGIQLVGEEPVNGRTAVKYRYSRTANTGTSAGQVNTESFIFIDKETGLPLRAELFGEASGNVQGVKGAKLVAEMRDISTTVDPTLFEVPTGMTKVSEAQVRAQVDAAANTIAMVLRTLLTNMNSNPAPAPSPSPSASPTTSPSP
ncbi:MAG: hypothetical protein DMF69_05370 [Acidobacteria bacterium]|nr:MAG: hypothetical protein DMF69_05370 [Acidobacteriota bacterium]